MSRGFGHVERSIQALLDRQPTVAFTVETIARHVYPTASIIEKKHRVSVLRALGRMPDTTGRVMKLGQSSRVPDTEASAPDDDGRLKYEYRPALTAAQQEDFIAMWEWAEENHHFDDRPKGTEMEFGPSFLGLNMVNWMHQPDELIDALRLTDIVVIYRRIEDEWMVDAHHPPHWDNGDLRARYERENEARTEVYKREREAANAAPPKKARRK